MQMFLKSLFLSRFQPSTAGNQNIFKLIVISTPFGGAVFFCLFTMREHIIYIYISRYLALTRYQQKLLSQKHQFEQKYERELFTFTRFLVEFIFTLSLIFSLIYPISNEEKTYISSLQLPL